MYNPLKNLAACLRCKHLEEFGTHAAFDYCSNRFPNPMVSFNGIDISLSIEDYELGCEDFNWNGIPMDRETYQRFIENRDYSTSVLKNIPKEQIIVDPSEDIDISCGGAYFRLDLLLKQHPELEPQLKHLI